MSLIGAVVGDQLALNSIKYNTVHNTNVLLPLILLFGGLAYFSLSNMIKRQGMGVSNASWNVLSTALGVLIGYLVWDENVHIKQVIGILFGITSLYLMNGSELKEEFSI